MVFESQLPAVDIPTTDLLTWLFDECKYDVERPILIDAEDTSKFLSQQGVKTIVRQLSAGLRAEGFQQSDHVMSVTRNSIYIYPFMYGCIAAGVKCTAANIAWTARELRDAAISLNITHFLVEPDFLPVVLESAESVGIEVARIIVLDSDNEKAIFNHEKESFNTWRSLLLHGEADWSRLHGLEAAKQTVALGIFTSGTSGGIKAVQFSHYKLISHLVSWDGLFGNPDYEVKSLHMYPPWGLGGNSLTTASLKQGFPLYYQREFSLEKLKHAFATLRPTVMMLDPRSMQVLAKTTPPESSGLHCLRDIRSVGSLAPKETLEALKPLLHPDCIVSQVYSATETGTISAMPYTYRDQYDPNSAGFQWPGIYIRLMDNDGVEITSHDTPGEIRVKSPSTFQDYFNDPTSSAAVFDEEGYYCTGDIGYISSKTSQWYISGRKKEVFKIKFGSYLNPAEIEALLVSHPDISDAVVAPVYKDGKHDDPILKAYIVKTEGKALTEAQVTAFIKGQISKWKELDGGVEFVDRVPRNALGKIERWRFDEMLRKSLGKDNDEAPKISQG